MRDPYLYKDIDVMKNKLNIKDQEKLESAEAAITVSKLLQITDFENGSFNIEKLKAIHKYIFGDIYEWAGEFRKMNIEKSERVLNGLSVKYSDYRNVEKDAEKVIDKLNSVNNWSNLSLDQQAEKLSNFTAELWRVHCFREGNTRTTITFIELFAKSNGIEINKTLLKNNSAYVRDSLVLSSIDEYSESQYLTRIIKDTIQPIQGDNIRKKIIDVYIKRFPAIKNISEKTAKILNDLNIKHGKNLSIQEIKDLYNKAGKKLESVYDNNDLQEFKNLTQVIDDLKNAKLKLNQEQIHEKSQLYNKSKNIELTK
ncbi:Fic/DOC family protein [Clostridium butyricum]|uniref:Fic/DOC family protein n=1 Tax=Clostridium butyricum TaxID=1492 RepID=UPI00374E31AA